MALSSKLSNRKLQSIQTHDTVYRTAISLFETKGFESITVDEICKEANVSIGTFYNVFKSKYSILDHIFELADQYFYSIVKPQLSVGTLREKILLYFDHYAQYNANNGIEFMKQLYNVKNNLFAKKGRLMQAILIEVIQTEIDQGLSIQHSAEDIVDFLFICERGLVYDWILKNGSFDLVDATKKHIDLLLKSFNI